MRSVQALGFLLVAILMVTPLGFPYASSEDGNPNFTSCWETDQCGEPGPSTVGDGGGQ